MRSLRKVAVLAVLLACVPARGGEVIAHPSVTLDAEEIRELFLGERQFAGKLKLVPIDNRAILDEFLSKVLQTDVRTYSARWTKKTFREGLSAPDMKGSDAEVAAFVRTTPGAVGYVSGTATGVKVLLKY